MLLVSSVLQMRQGSTIASSIDSLFDFLFWVSVVGLFAVTVATVWFAWRYRRGRIAADATPYIDGHTPSELTVAGLLFVLVMVIFYWGWVGYERIVNVPANAMEINVTGRQWQWLFEYPNGRKMAGELVVPLGRPVHLLMTSTDVLHSFYVPGFRLKQDVIPNSYTSLWFEPTETGEFQVFCAEYCGTAHSQMLAKLHVLEAKEYDRWQTRWEYKQKLGDDNTVASGGVGAANASAGNTVSLVDRGKKFFNDKGCTSCHSSTDARMVGPGLGGVFGSEVSLEGGGTVTADENYLRESIMQSTKKVVRGFPPIMPIYQGTLTDDEINALVAYIKSLGN